jgi:protein SCO1/2
MNPEAGREGISPRRFRARNPAVLRLAMLLTWLILMLIQGGCQARLRGTDLGGQPAHDFQLTNQFGHPVALSDFRGKPIVLTFLYTNCPDICPLTAERLRLTARLLGSDASNVAMLAVSTDPVRDTVEAAYAFTAAHDMLERMHFLVGSRPELEPIWNAYYVAALEQQVEGATMRRIGHTDAVIVIDKQGRMRSLLRSDFDHAALADDLRALLRE